VAGAVDSLRTRVPLGIVSDGDPKIQAAKLAALDLAPAFSVVVWSDDHGRAHRKPDPLPFQLAAQGLGVPPDTIVYIGDRPAKDVAGAAGAGMHSMRVRTGEWVEAPDDDRALGSYDSVIDAIAAITALIDDPPDA
jgi:putative hydrolase of the HAD superfamily